MHRTLRRMLIPLCIAVLFIPNGSAYVAAQTWDDTDTCYLQGVVVCEMEAKHNLWIWSCYQSGGTYTSCEIYHACYGGPVSNLLPGDWEVSCTGFADVECQTLLPNGGSSCSSLPTQSGYMPTLYAGNCGYYSVSGTFTPLVPTSSPASVSHTFKVCVSASTGGYFA